LQNDSKVKIEILYKHFLLTKASHLPVVDAEGNLIGLLSKDRVLRELADLGEERTEYKTIPIALLDKELSEGLINFFRDSNKLPVLGDNGERKEFWDKPRFLAEFHKLDATQKTDPKLVSLQEKKERVRDTKESIHWFMEMILANFPDGLVATDVAGNVIFYNEAFEKKFLPLPFFKDSIETAEGYLKDLNRDLFGSYLRENDLEIESKGHSLHKLQTLVKDVDAFVKMITLRKEEKVAGFLYQFSPLTSNLDTISNKGTVFPDLDMALAAKFPLERVLEEMESRYIYETLKRNKNNISHAAQELEIPRTTLQNRIKFLNITERFKEEEDGKKKMVVPRKRTNAHISLPKKESKKDIGKLSPKKKTIPTKKKAKVAKKQIIKKTIAKKKMKTVKNSKKRR